MASSDCLWSSVCSSLQSLFTVKFVATFVQLIVETMCCAAVQGIVDWKFCDSSCLFETRMKFNAFQQFSLICVMHKDN